MRTDRTVRRVRWSRLSITKSLTAGGGGHCHIKAEVFVPCQQNT